MRLREREQELSPQEQRHGGEHHSIEATLIAHGAKLEGSIVSAGSLTIEGSVKGEILSEGDVTIAHGGVVEADVKAPNITISGMLRGNAVAQSRIELSRTGQIEGNVSCRALAVEEGGVFNGQSSMQSTQGAARKNPAGGGSMEEAKPESEQAFV